MVVAVIVAEINFLAGRKVKWQIIKTQQRLGEPDVRTRLFDILDPGFPGTFRIIAISADWVFDANRITLVIHGPPSDSHIGKVREPTCSWVPRQFHSMETRPFIRLKRSVAENILKA